MSQYNILPALTPDNFQPHALHSDKYTWVEKNCYVDLYIEIIHAFNMDPCAMLPFTVASDFSGDQWTFFKPQISEIRDLYGIDIQEMSYWRTLLEHAVEHTGSGRIIGVEVDSYWLPDTAATDYRMHHGKTTIAIIKLDIENEQLHYFHNAGFYKLCGEDFRQIFKIGIAIPEDYLPPYAELIHLESLVRHSSETLAEISYVLLQKYVRLRPKENPIQRYAMKFANDLPYIQEQGLDYYHLWAFNNTRQLGASFELAATNLHWLTEAKIADFTPAINSFNKISDSNKALILKVARAVNKKRPLDLSETFEQMANDWEQGMQCLVNTLDILD